MSTTVPLRHDASKNDVVEQGIPPQHTFATFIPRWWSIAKLWVTGREKWRARGYIAAAIGLNVLYTVLLVQVSYTQRNLSTAMSEKNISGFYESVWVFVVIICVAGPLFALSGFVEERLTLAWRVFLVNRLLQSYFDHKTYFHLNAYSELIDNPDQRICDDIYSFVSASVFLTMNLSRKLFNLIAFAGVLWSISPQLVVFLLCYASAGTFVTGGVFGKPLMRLNFQILHREGDLRYSLVRVRENAESIAFYNGQLQEHYAARHKFDRIVHTILRKITWAAGLNLWTNMYSFATILVPSLLTAPRYFAGEVEFGVIAQATYAFDRMNDALATFIDNFEQISGLSAQTERLVTLMDLMDRIEADRTAPHHAGSKIVREMAEPPILIRMDQLEFKTPGGEQIIADRQDLILNEGESLLVMGPSGCGKSSLLRVLSGLWSQGRGTVALPDAALMFFLPQKPYMPLGSFRQQLLFPNSLQFEPPDARLLSLLSEVQLSHVLERVGGFSAEIDWAQVLSLGEQQRVAFLRLFLSSPQFAALDEATSALDVETERQLYSKLKSICPSYISVGHRPQLREYHTHLLEYSGNGTWVKKRLNEGRFQTRQNLLLD